MTKGALSWTGRRKTERGDGTRNHNKKKKKERKRTTLATVKQSERNSSAFLFHLLSCFFFSFNWVSALGFFFKLAHPRVMFSMNESNPLTRPKTKSIVEAKKKVQTVLHEVEIRGWSDFPKEKGECIDIPPFESAPGVVWKLSIYPGGDTKASDGFVSVYLELISVTQGVTSLQVAFIIRLIMKASSNSGNGHLGSIFNSGFASPFAIEQQQLGPSSAAASVSSATSSTVAISGTTVAEASATHCFVPDESGQDNWGVRNAS